MSLNVRFIVVSTFLLKFWFLVKNVNCKFDIKQFIPDPLTPRLVVEDVIEYFQQDDPKGIPVLNLPDVIVLGGPFETTRMTLDNVSISGHNDISLEYTDLNLRDLQFQIRLRIPRLEILAVYEWPGWFGTSYGDLNVTFIDLHVGAVCNFGINDNDNFEVVTLEPILEKELFIPTFTGLSAEHSVIVLAADTFFDTIILPFIQGAIQEKGTARINQRLNDRLGDRYFPIDLSPVDYMIAKTRSDLVKKRNLDPFKIGSKVLNYMGFNFELKKVEIKGLSTLHRTDLIRTEFVDNRIYVTVELGTKNIKGSTDWEIYSDLFSMASGHFDIVIDSLGVSVELMQDADVRNKPVVRNIDIALGNIALRSEGERNADYFLEALVNILPNVLREGILDKRIESRLEKVIQERFNNVDLRDLINKRIEKLEAEKAAASE